MEPMKVEGRRGLSPDDLKPGSYKFSARLLYVTQKNGRVMAERDFWI